MPFIKIYIYKKHSNIARERVVHFEGMLQFLGQCASPPPNPDYHHVKKKEFTDQFSNTKKPDKPQNPNI